MIATTSVEDRTDAHAPIGSIIVPAHDEATVICRLLDGLTGDGAPPFEIVVVCNGCHDDTADRARAFGDAVTVVEIPDASKRRALRRAQREATHFPRLYVDADVELDAGSAARLVDALQSGSICAAAPRREVPFDSVSWPVRWFYDVWERLPTVRDGLFGRGVIALTEEANERVMALPPLMGDDLAASDAFTSLQRSIVDDAVVTVYPPKRLGDLIRRRVRAHTGNVEADRTGVRRASSRTSIRQLLALGRRSPLLVPKLVVFAAVAVVSRRRARRAIRRGDTDTWLRDESSRTST